MKQAGKEVVARSDSFYRSCKEQRPTFVEEDLGRFVNPLAVSYIRIPANSWPRNLVGEESTGTLAENSRTTRDSTANNFDDQFVEHFSDELMRGSERDDAPTLALLYNRALVTSQGRVSIVAMRKSAIDQASITERNETCVVTALDMCTFRVEDSVRNSNNVATFNQIMKAVRESVVDMRQCQSLLRRTIRACWGQDDSGVKCDFDKTRAIGEIASNGGIDYLHKEYVAFMSALQTRKWMNQVNITVLHIKLRNLEQERNKAARALNEAVASSAYERLSAKLQSEQKSAQHATNQLTMMRTILNNARYNLNQIFAHMYNKWNELSERSRRSMDMLRAYNIQLPPLVQANFERDVFGLDVFKTIEIMRSVNILLLKQIEDEYDRTYELYSPLNMRSGLVSRPGETFSERAYLASIEGEDTTKNNLRYTTIESINYLLNKIQETRNNYSSGRFNLAPTDIRHLVFAYQKFVKYRLDFLGHQLVNANSGAKSRLADLELQPITEHEIRQRVRDKLRSISAASVDKKVARWLNDQEREFCSDILNLNFDDEEIRRDFQCRPIGDTVVLLREIQDVYEYGYFVQMLDRDLERLIVLRHQAQARLINVDSEFAKWDDRDTSYELEKNIRSTFRETLGTWDRLVQRIGTLEQQANADVNSSTGRSAHDDLTRRINCWLYRNVDDLNLTVLNAKFTVVDSSEEMRSIMKSVSRFAYLLSWLLEIRAFVSREEPVPSPKESESEESADEEPVRRGPRIVNIKNVIRADDQIQQNYPQFSRQTNVTYGAREQTVTNETPATEQAPGDLTTNDAAGTTGQQTSTNNVLPEAPTANEIRDAETPAPSLDELIGRREASRISNDNSQRNEQQIQADVSNVNNLNITRRPVPSDFAEYDRATDRNVSSLTEAGPSDNVDFNDEAFEENMDEQFGGPETYVPPRRGVRRRLDQTYNSNNLNDDYGPPTKRPRAEQAYANETRPTDDRTQQTLDEEDTVMRDVSRRQSGATTRPAQTRQRFNEMRGRRDPEHDPLRGTNRPTIARPTRPRQNVNMGLQRLRRIADNAPSDVGIGLLNNAYQNEMKKKSSLRSNIRKNLDRLLSRLNIPEVKFTRVD